ncbi:MAG TPA: DUF192 domain-containing protein [Roseiflexaceae bacterium]|nr:DUF192 domain-containing protein [Roseiflexaceae bacterium]
MLRRWMLVCVAIALVACGRAEGSAPAATSAGLAPTVPPTTTPAPTAALATLPPANTVELDMGATNLPNIVTPQAITPTIQLTLGSGTLEAELAVTGEQRQQGLMFRTSMPEDYGMLFVFPTDETLTFWMRDTHIPLSIAFIDAGGRILNLDDMQPLDDKTFHTSNGMARYALEVNQGWFAAHGVQAGDVVDIQLPPDLEVR